MSSGLSSLSNLLISARDTSGTRSYSSFLVELAERLPDMMKPSLAILSTHLDGESYTMRKVSRHTVITLS